jgi:hypothetical protein
MNILIAAGNDFNEAQNKKHSSSERIDVIDHRDKVLQFVGERNYERIVLDFKIIQDTDFLKRLAQLYSGALNLYNVDSSERMNVEEACRGMKLRYVRSATDGI